MDNYNVQQPQYGQPQYGQQGGYRRPQQQGNDYYTICLLALIFGCVAFIFDPFYLTSLAAIVLGIIGHINSKTHKGMAIAGWICGLCSIGVQVIIDILTLGMGIFC